MDKSLIKPLENWLAIPEIVNILGLSRARIHQLIEEDKFDIADMRVVGDKRMVLIKNEAVDRQLQAQEERAARLAADKAAEEQRIMGRMIIREATKAMQNKSLEVSPPTWTAEAIPEAIPEATELDEVESVG